MKSVNRKYIVALIVVVIIVITLKVMNPYQEYSTEAYWESATVESVYQVPEEALEPGNGNGSVLMWAASVVTDPDILKALVKRGADINEVEPLFSGTPLTAAVVDNESPEIIEELIKLGANTDVRISYGNTALMAAAIYNPNPKVLEVLIQHGANIGDKNDHGKTALELAQDSSNESAVKYLSEISNK